MKAFYVVSNDYSPNLNTQTIYALSYFNAIIYRSQELYSDPKIRCYFS